MATSKVLVLGNELPKLQNAWESSWFKRLRAILTNYVTVKKQILLVCSWPLSLPSNSWTKVYFLISVCKSIDDVQKHDKFVNVIPFEQWSGEMFANFRFGNTIHVKNYVSSIELYLYLKQKVTVWTQPVEHEKRHFKPSLQGKC